MKTGIKARQTIKKYKAGRKEKIGLIQRENPCKERNITG